jgi:hypothetical protein
LKVQVDIGLAKALDIAKKFLGQKQRFMKEKKISSSWRGNWIDARL